MEKLIFKRKNGNFQKKIVLTIHVFEEALKQNEYNVPELAQTYWLDASNSLDNLSGKIDSACFNDANDLLIRLADAASNWNTVDSLLGKMSLLVAFKIADAEIDIWVKKFFCN